MITILLYGFLGKKFGKVHQYDVKSSAEAVRALCTTIKGFKEAVIDGGAYKILVGGTRSISEKDLNNPISSKESIRIIPTVSGRGGGNNPWVNVIIGAILIYLTWGAGASVLAGWGASSGVVAVVGQIGISMVIGGVASLLMPSAKPQEGGIDSYEQVTNKPSHFFNGAVNTAAQGNAVPVCYGRLIVGSQVVSAGLTAEQL